MHTHLINDNRDDKDRIQGSAFWAGRFYVYFDENGREQVNVQWSFGRRAHSTHLSLDVDFVSENDITVSFGLWRLFMVYFTIHSHRFPNWSYSHGERKLGVDIHDGSIWLHLWDDPNDSHLHRMKVLPVVDWLFGKRRRNERLVVDGERNLVLPEGNYRLRIAVSENTWRRRFWIADRVLLATIIPNKPVPIPGNTDSDFYSGEDAIHEVTLQAATIDDAASKFFHHVYADRVRHGGVGWRPKEGRE